MSARVNQIISGLAINLFALGITGFLDPVVFGAGNTGAQVPAFSNLKIPGLGAIPVVGSALFDQPMFAYLAIVLVVLVSLYFRYTRSGLALHAVGEMPAAAEARGISVVRTRYAATIISGILAGVGGAALSIGVVNSFVENMTAGRGYIALAAVVFAGWRPLVAAAACLVFGIADAAQVSLERARCARRHRAPGDGPVRRHRTCIDHPGPAGAGARGAGPRLRPWPAVSALMVSAETSARPSR